MSSVRLGLRYEMLASREREKGGAQWTWLKWNDD